MDTLHCLTDAWRESLAGGGRPWSPGRREDDVDMERRAEDPDKTWCLAQVDIFCDLDDQEMSRIADAAPRKTYSAGELIYTPHQPLETLFILKQGRIRIFRVSEDGRALTTAIIEPGTIFGEMAVIGQRMHDSFAEAIDETVACTMSTADVRRLLLGDPRIAARISETLGRRLGELEQRLSDTVFKSVPERIAGTLVTLAAGTAVESRARENQVRLTHEQVAALAASSRETTTKVLGEFVERGLITLKRGRITILNDQGLRRVADGEGTRPR